jgi:hypothetical protein
MLVRAHTFACLATWAALQLQPVPALLARALQLQPAPALLVRAPRDRVQRTRPLFAQLVGWTTQVDAASGETYYCDEQTGQCQWEPPQATTAQGSYRGQVVQEVVWRLVPTTGVYSEYAVRNGEEQVLGRADMAEPSRHVSERQCIVQVAADGSAELISVGDLCTLVRPRDGAPWKRIATFGTRDLADGKQISLNREDPEGAIFTIRCQEESADMGGGDGVQYSDDGQWMWTGTEWTPAAIGPSGGVAAEAPAASTNSVSDDGQWMWTGAEWVPAR